MQCFRTYDSWRVSHKAGSRRSEEDTSIWPLVWTIVGLSEAQTQSGKLERNVFSSSAFQSSKCATN